MASFYDDNEDLRWYIDHGIDWGPLVRITEHDLRAEGGHASVEEAVGFYREVLGLVGEFSAEQVAPRWRTWDAAHPRLVNGEVVQHPEIDALFAQIGELGLHGLCVPREFGGLNAPFLVMQVTHELLARADVSICAHNGFHGGMALGALMYGILEGTTTFQADPPRFLTTRFRELIDDVLAGRAWGSMDITEPDAGSDMAALRARGEQRADGSWTVTGQKIFITSGHGRWHFVIARTEEAKGDDAMAGLDGLSLFLVPAFAHGPDGPVRAHTSIDAVEHKLGHNASATVAISFDHAPAQLIGERGQGFRYMLLLMNGARVGVGFEALGLMEAAHRCARAYAEGRRSMGKTLDQHEMIADSLDEMRTDIQAVRALCMSAALHEELGQKLDIQLRFQPPADPTALEDLRRRARRHRRRSRALTPLLKYYAAERAVEAARRAVQIHGGCGYMSEYPAEKLLRDAMVFPIYEGTSQIQALMAMKDTLVGVIKDPGRFLRRTAAARWRAISARDPLERRVGRLQGYQQQAVQFLLTRLAAAKIRDLRGSSGMSWMEALRHVDPKRDFALALLHAERLTRILTDAAIAEVLWEQASAHPERRDLLERWLERAEPRSRHQLDEITTLGPRLLRVLAGTAEAPRQIAGETHA